MDWMFVDLLRPSSGVGHCRGRAQVRAGARDEAGSDALRRGLPRRAVRRVHGRRQELGQPQGARRQGERRW